MLQMQQFTSLLLKFKSNLLISSVFFLLSAAFAMAILDLFSRINTFPTLWTKVYRTLSVQLNHNSLMFTYCLHYVTMHVLRARTR